MQKASFTLNLVSIVTEALTEATHFLEWWDKRIKRKMKTYQSLSTPLLDVERRSSAIKKSANIKKNVSATEEEEMVGG